MKTTVTINGETREIEVEATDPDMYYWSSVDKKLVVMRVGRNGQKLYPHPLTFKLKEGKLVSIMQEQAYWHGNGWKYVVDWNRSKYASQLAKKRVW